MNENIKISIKRHLDTLDKAVQLTKIILEFARNKNHDNIIKESRNRGYLFNIIGYMQRKIELSIKANSLDIESDSMTSHIEQWQSISGKKTEFILRSDQEILEYLDYEKDHIKREIASIHKKSIAHKNYALSSLKI